MPSRAALRGRLGPYRHLLDLGHGGMAEVWLAARSDVVTDPSELRVIKELKEDLSDDEDARRMFLDEGRLAMQLEHPNIVVTHEVVSYNDKPFIVMEYLDGQSLHTVRRRRGFPLAAELFVAEQVLQGLTAAHNLTGPQQDTLHVVHRDVSPRNVFITYGGDVKVVDFGIAKVRTGAKRSHIGEIKGTAAYMAPEQVRTDCSEDHRADLFAVGVLLWEALTEREMWRGLPNVAIMSRLAGGEIPNLKAHQGEFPEGLLTLVNDALSFNPEHRPPSAIIMRQRLLEALEVIQPSMGAAGIASWMTQAFEEQRSLTERTLAQRLNPRASTESTSASLSPALPPKDAPGTATLTEALDGAYRTLTPLQYAGETGYLEVEHTVSKAPFLLQVRSAQSDPAFFKRAPAVALLRHPNTVRLADYGTVVDDRYLFMLHERVNGITLMSALERKKTLSHRSALKILRQLLSSLAEAHEASLPHGRLQASKVVLVDGKDNWIKVLGHGGPLRSAHGVADDLAAVGRIFYQMLFGEDPWRGDPRVCPPALKTTHMQRLDVPVANYIKRLFGLRQPFESASAALRALPAVELDLLQADGTGAVAPILFGAGTTTHTSVLRARLRRLMSPRQPSIWVLMGDPAIDDARIRAATDRLADNCVVTWLDEEDRTNAIEKLRRESIDPPWVLMFGDLHVLLNEPLLDVLSAVGEVSRLLVSTHANADLLESTVNTFGLDHQICLPTDKRGIITAVEAMIDRTRNLRHFYDDVRIALAMDRGLLNSTEP